MIDHISIVIITRNAAHTLPATLDSVRAFANVVVWDNGSTDDTKAIATAYPNVTWVDAMFIGFGPSKNAAADCAHNDWVFSLDADETLSPELVDALRCVQPATNNIVGLVLRTNQMMGRIVRRGGWGDDHLVRLFHRRTHRFTDAAVHEKVAETDATERVVLSGTVNHNAVQQLSQFLEKTDRYTELRRQSQTRTYPAPVIVLKAGFAFFRSYVLQLGVLAGWRGLVIAWSEADGVFYKYMKILADRRHAAERNPPNG